MVAHHFRIHVGNVCSGICTGRRTRSDKDKHKKQYRGHSLFGSNTLRNKKFVVVVFLSVLVTLLTTLQTPENYAYSSDRFAEKKIETSGKPLFHLMHATNEESFSERNIKGLESIFFHHPNAQVKLYVHDMSTKPIQPLIQAGYNITLHPIQLERTMNLLLSKLSPSQLNAASVRAFMDKIPTYSQHQYWYANLSDLLRLAFLYMEGGVYLDTDVILVRPLFPTPATTATCDYLPYDNVVAWEDSAHHLVNGAVMKFQRGHPFLLKCLQGFFDDFQIDLWAHNGPKLLTQVWERQMKNMTTTVTTTGTSTSTTPQTLDLVPSQPTVEGAEDSHCAHNTNPLSDPESIRFPQLPDVTTLERRSFYPFYYPKIVPECMNRFGDVPAKIEDISHRTFAVHTYNKISGNSTFEEGSLCHWLYNAFCVVSNCSIATNTRT